MTNASLLKLVLAASPSLMLMRVQMVFGTIDRPDDDIKKDSYAFAVVPGDEESELVLRDYLLETKWFDARVMRLVFPLAPRQRHGYSKAAKLKRIADVALHLAGYRDFFDAYVAPSNPPMPMRTDFVQAILAVLLFGHFTRRWPVVVALKKRMAAAAELEEANRPTPTGMMGLTINGLASSDRVPGTYVDIQYARGPSVSTREVSFEDITSEQGAIALFGEGSPMHRAWMRFQDEEMERERVFRATEPADYSGRVRTYGERFRR